MANKDSTVVVKMVDGKLVKIENAAIHAKLVTLMTSSPASENVRELAHDSEFVTGTGKGSGKYVATRSIEKDGVKYVATYELEKSETSKLFAAIREIENALSIARKFVNLQGDLPARGRKALEADYSEL